MNELPKLMNGSGMPVMGMNPTVIPMFSRIWNVHIADDADDDERAEEVARAMPRSRATVRSSARYSPSRSTAPRKPSSSPRTEKMKSVCRSGRKLQVALGPRPQALAGELSRPDRDLALLEVVAGALAGHALGRRRP